MAECSARFKILRCCSSGQERFFCDAPTHPCILPVAFPVIPAQCRLVIMDLRSRMHTSRNILDLARRQFPYVTESQVATVLRSYRQKMSDLATVEEVKNYVRNNLLDTVREGINGVRHPHPFFFGDCAQGRLGTGAAGSHLRLNVTSRAWLEQLALYQATGRPLMLIVDGTYKEQHS